MLCGVLPVPLAGSRFPQVPWGEEKSHLTTAYKWFLAGWARRLAWKEVAEAFNTTWDNGNGGFQRAHGPRDPLQTLGSAKLFVMGPHAEDLHSFFIFNNLVD